MVHLLLVFQCFLVTSFAIFSLILPVLHIFHFRDVFMVMEVKVLQGGKEELDVQAA